ncbi:hypothetical protein HY041_00640, partial [Candidatus Roizmanbacteria bacterium]|nr:hypothetical protein [Candidatus Roizmanbacteria bacterium]
QVGFPDFLSTIKAVSPQAPKSKEVEIKYYEGKQAVNHIYEEGLNAKEFRAYVNCHELSKVFPENENRFLEAHNKKNDMNIWEIMENSPEAREYIKKIPKKRYYHKFIPEGMNLSIIDYIIFDGKVAIVNLEKHTTGVLISNEHYYNNAKALFEFVWQMLP